MIKYIFISFSAVQIYELSYIHLYSDLTYVKEFCDLQYQKPFSDQWKSRMRVDGCWYWSVLHSQCLEFHAESVECALRKPYWRGVSRLFCSINDSILLNTIFSKILLKLESRVIGLWLLTSVSSSCLKIGIIFAIFSLEGYTLVEIDILKISARIPLKRFEEHFNICVGHEYKP